MRRYLYTRRSTDNWSQVELTNVIGYFILFFLFLLVNQIGYFLFYFILLGEYQKHESNWIPIQGAVSTLIWKGWYNWILRAISVDLNFVPNTAVKVFFGTFNYRCYLVTTKLSISWIEMIDTKRIHIQFNLYILVL